MNELLDQLTAYSFQLYKLNMRQAAGDYDYFVAWMRSSDPINPNKHYGVAPAGENTVAPLANNCPIPFTPTNLLTRGCTNKEVASDILSFISNLLSEMDSKVAGDDEVTALNEYKSYTSTLKSFLDE